MKDYYQILGVSRTASAEEIKRVYRSLAVKYHPDKNHDPSAEAIFKEMNEAYDVLSDPTKKWTYDQQRDRQYRNYTVTPVTPTQQSPVPVNDDPRYRRRRPANAPPPVRKVTAADLMQQYLGYVLWVNWLGFIVVLLLLTDYILPQRISHETIEGIDAVYTTGNRRTASQLRYEIVHMQSGREIKIYERDQASNFKEGQLVLVMHTPFLQTVRYLTDVSRKYEVALYGIYGPVGIIPLILMVTSMAGLFFRQSVEIRFTFSIASAFLTFLTLCLIFAL